MTSIIDIPEHERCFKSHPDTLRGKEEAVIEAAIARRVLEVEGRERAEKHLPSDYRLGLQFFEAVRAENEAIDALIIARTK